MYLYLLTNDQFLFYNQDEESIVNEVITAIRQSGSLQGFTTFAEAADYRKVKNNQGIKQKSIWKKEAVKEKDFAILFVEVNDRNYQKLPRQVKTQSYRCAYSQRSIPYYEVQPGEIIHLISINLGHLKNHLLFKLPQLPKEILFYITNKLDPIS